MKPYIERFTFNTIFDLDQQREFMLRKVHLSKAGSSRFYPVFVPRAGTGTTTATETAHSE
jgi:hypothetical protein